MISQVTDFVNALLLQPLFHYFSDTRNLPHVERSQKFLLSTREYVQHTVRLGLVGADFRNHPRCADANGAIEAGGGLHRLMQGVRRAQRWSVQTLRAGHVNVGLIDRHHLQLRRVPV